MEHTTDEPTVRVDNYTRASLTLIAVLLTVLIAGLWSHGPRPVSEARAEVPEALKPGAQMVAQQKRTNATLKEILKAIKDLGDREGVDLKPLRRAQQDTTDVLRDVRALLRARRTPATTPKSGEKDADDQK